VTDAIFVIEYCRPHTIELVSWRSPEINTVISDHHIRVISEGSCDTEDWSNDDKYTGINYTLLYIHVENRW